MLRGSLFFYGAATRGNRSLCLLKEVAYPHQPEVVINALVITVHARVGQVAETITGGQRDLIGKEKVNARTSLCQEVELGTLFVCVLGGVYHPQSTLNIRGDARGDLL